MKKNNLFIVIGVFIISIIVSIISGFLQRKGAYSSFYILTDIIGFFTLPAAFILFYLFSRVKVHNYLGSKKNMTSILWSIYLPIVITFHFLILNLIVHLPVTDMSDHWFLWLIPIPFLMFSLYIKLKAQYKYTNLIVYIITGVCAFFYIYLYFGLMLIGNHV